MTVSDGTANVGALVAPSIHWHPEYGYSLAERDALVAIGEGCCGMLLTGGPVTETVALLERLRAASPSPFFAAAELGAGVGERFSGATALPPLAAFDAADLDAIRRAARLTAREARATGITWALAPSCVSAEHAAPLVRSRTFNGDDASVGSACAEWLDACQAEGVVAVPGPYPWMHAAAAEAALDGGVGAMLLAASHATDPETIRYLREDAGFEGVIVAPLAALANERDEDEEDVAIACLTAGCDLLLGSEDGADVARALHAAWQSGALDDESVRASCERVRIRAEWAGVVRPGRDVTLDDALWARRIADGAVHAQRGTAYALTSPVELIIVDDDPPRADAAGTAMRETLGKLGIEVRTAAAGENMRGAVVIALVGARRIGLGFETFSDGALARVSDQCARAARAARDLVVVHFTPPHFGESLPLSAAVVCAWSGTRAMEEAAARWLVRGGRATA